jgi:hypothetical protein
VCLGSRYLDHISLRRAFHYAGMWFRCCRDSRGSRWPGIEGRGKSLDQPTEPKRVQLRATATLAYAVNTSSLCSGWPETWRYRLYIISENLLQQILHKSVAWTSRPPSLLAWLKCQICSVHEHVFLMMPTAALPRHTLGCAISLAYSERSIVPTALLLH